jgi:hypothetical protein
MLLSFERPARRRQLAAFTHALSVTRPSLLADLENCTVANVNGYHRVVTLSLLKFTFSELQDHRQDSKGAWWMPRHQESMKGVNGCDKPR